METERIDDRLVAQMPIAKSALAQPPSEHLEQILDEALDATFPCSDPVSTLCVEYEAPTH
jgi:hypothetical protein